MSEAESKSVFERMQDIAAAGGGTLSPTVPGITVFDDSWKEGTVTILPPQMGSPAPTNPPPGPYSATKAVDTEVTVNRRTRRTKAQMMADGDKTAPAVEATPKPAKAAIDESTQLTQPWSCIDTLYINCMPLEEFTAFFELLRDAKAAMGCDYRLGEHYAFGRGAGHLIEAVGIAVQNAKPNKVVIDTGTPEAGICLEMLKGVSRHLVIGTR